MYIDRPSRIPANLWFIVALVVLLGAAVGGYALFARSSSPEKQMNEAIAAMGRALQSRGSIHHEGRDQLTREQAARTLASWRATARQLELTRQIEQARHTS